MRVKNSTLRLWSALGGLGVVGVIALVTVLGHQPTPAISYNLSSPPPQQGLSTIGPPATTPAAAPSVVSIGMFNMGGVGSNSPTCETWPASTGNGITAQVSLQLADPSAAPVTVKSIAVQYTDLSGNAVATETYPIPAGQSATVAADQASSFSLTAPSSVTLDFYGSDNYGCTVTGVS